jgi:putative transferase (TIGR04331 family)
MEGFEIYFDDQMAFFDHLEHNILKHMEYRPYPDNTLGWNKILYRMKERLPEVLVVQDREISDALNAAKIIIIDHNITTFLQAMVINRPVVCFWQPFIFPLRPECVEDFEFLRKVGILYDDPVSAAQHVNAIWQTADEWWQSNEVQKARNTFVAKYARTATDFAVQWRTMLEGIAQDTKTTASSITGQKKEI